MGRFIAWTGYTVAQVDALMVSYPRVWRAAVRETDAIRLRQRAAAVGLTDYDGD